MFEIWQHRGTGERYLVVYREGVVSVAAGPLRPYEDPIRVLETQSNQNHNPRALLAMHQQPGAYRREYSRDHHGVVRPVPAAEAMPRVADR
jgi:hypothetical protein